MEKIHKKGEEAKRWDEDVGGGVHGVESAHHVGRTGHGERYGEDTKLTRTILGRGRMGRMDRSLSKFETLHDLRHRNLVSSAAQYLDTYRSWPCGHVFCCRVLVWRLFPLSLAWLVICHRNPCLKVGVEKR